jgi:hypothetical protein
MHIRMARILSLVKIFDRHDLDAWLNDIERTTHVLAKSPQDPRSIQDAVVNVLMQDIRQFAADQQRLMQLREIVRHHPLRML